MFRKRRSSKLRFTSPELQLERADQRTESKMKLSIVVICWNDRSVIGNCLHSILDRTHSIQYEIIVTDNGSVDGSVQFIRDNFPSVRIVENGENLGFAKANNCAFQISAGELVLILNPDTIFQDRAIDELVNFADERPEAGAFGCRVLNADGSIQRCARPFPTIWRGWLWALGLRPLGNLSDMFISDIYPGWKGDTERPIDWQSGCCLMVRTHLLRRLGGFDERFSYHCQDVDLCHRIWDEGYSVLYTPKATITHLGGFKLSRFGIRFEIEKYRNNYQYFYKYYGARGVCQFRLISLVSLRTRQLHCRVMQIGSARSWRYRMEVYRVCVEWNQCIKPLHFVRDGAEPQMNLPADSISVAHR
jgi:GT2 family glycosyltransferase